MGSAAQTIHLSRLHSLQPEAAMQQSLYRATARVSGMAMVAMPSFNFVSAFDLAAVTQAAPQKTVL